MSVNVFLPQESLSKYANLSAAVASIGSTETVLVVNTNTTISTNVEIPQTIHLKVEQGNFITVNDGILFEVWRDIDAGAYKIFNWTGTPDFRLRCKNTKIEWFGAVAHKTNGRILRVTNGALSTVLGGTRLNVYSATANFVTAGAQPGDTVALSKIRGKAYDEGIYTIESVTDANNIVLTATSWPGPGNETGLTVAILQGVTDSTAAINMALSVCKHIHFGAGWYLVSSMLFAWTSWRLWDVQESNLALSGIGAETRIYAYYQDGPILHMRPGTHTIKDLTLIGSESGDWFNCGLQLQGTAYGVIDNIYIQSTAGPRLLSNWTTFTQFNQVHMRRAGVDAYSAVHNSGQDDGFYAPYLLVDGWTNSCTFYDCETRAYYNQANQADLSIGNFAYDPYDTWVVRDDSVEIVSARTASASAEVWDYVGGQLDGDAAHFLLPTATNNYPVFTLTTGPGEALESKTVTINYAYFDNATRQYVTGNTTLLLPAQGASATQSVSAALTNLSRITSIEVPGDASPSPGTIKVDWARTNQRFATTASRWLQCSLEAQWIRPGNAAFRARMNGCEIDTLYLWDLGSYGAADGIVLENPTSQNYGGNVVKGVLSNLMGRLITQSIGSGTTSVPASRTLTVAGASFITWNVRPGNKLYVNDVSEASALIALVNELRTDYEAHRILTTGGVHGAADTTNVVTVAAATSYTTAFSLLTNLIEKYRKHIKLVTGGVHTDIDYTNALTLGAPGDAATAIAIANALKAHYNAHIADTSVHGAADATNAVTASDATALDVGVYLVHSVASETELVVDRDWPAGSQTVTLYQLNCFGAAVRFAQAKNKIDGTNTYAPYGDPAVVIEEGSNFIGGVLAGLYSGSGSKGVLDLNKSPFQTNRAISVPNARSNRIVDLQNNALDRESFIEARTFHMRGIRSYAGGTINDWIHRAVAGIGSEVATLVMDYYSVPIVRDVTIPSNITLLADDECFIVISGYPDVVVQGKFDAPRKYVIFPYQAQLLFEQDAFPEWVGWAKGTSSAGVDGTIYGKRAISASPHLVFEVGTYYITGYLQLATATRPSQRGVVRWTGQGRGRTIIKYQPAYSPGQPGLVNFAAETYSEVIFRGITFDASSHFNYCVSDASAVSLSGVVFEDCEFLGAASQSLSLAAENVTLRNCVVDGDYVEYMVLNRTTAALANDTPSFRGTWTSGTTVDFSARPGRPATCWLTFQDGKQRSASGTLAWSAANGVADLGYDESASSTGTDKLIYFYAVPSAANDALWTVRASDNPPTTGPAGYTEWKLIWACYEHTDALLKVEQIGNRFFFDNEDDVLSLDLGTGTDASPVSHNLIYIPESAGIAILQLYVVNGAFGVYRTGSSNVYSFCAADPGADTRTIIMPIASSSGVRNISYRRTNSGDTVRIYQIGWNDDWIDA